MDKHIPSHLIPFLDEYERQNIFLNGGSILHQERWYVPCRTPGVEEGNK